MGRMEEVEMSPQIKISSRQSGYYGGGRKEEERRAFRGIKKGGLFAKSWSAQIRMH